ncbi:3615_t:CDS:1 [Ambispora gerdemannii]|uniref:3615_t:CDS:1 n=1 Tax=Ambispora gerdemannii TaxID=144530 RepID=A0A9N9DWU8_9GLOM|nr:3615_t:CDS:1 [Ambispora gerdemannii]
MAKANNPLLENKDVSVLDPISNDITTRWNSTYLLLSRLLDLYETTKLLQQNLAKDKEREVRNDAKKMEKLLLNHEDLLGIQELVELLDPFAHVTIIMDGDHYPTLSIMLSLIKVLQEHLFRKAHTLTNPIIHKVRDEIELSFGECWDKPGLEGYIAAMLDPRFKDLSFESEKFETTKNELQYRMKKDMRNIYPTTYASENHVPSLLNSLFEEAPRQVCPVETELKIYFDMSKIPKHDLSDPLYKKYNPLDFWHDNRLTLLLMARQAQ